MKEKKEEKRKTRGSYKPLEKWLVKVLRDGEGICIQAKKENGKLAVFVIEICK